LNRVYILYVRLYYIKVDIIICAFGHLVIKLNDVNSEKLQTYKKITDKGTRTFKTWYPCCQYDRDKKQHTHDKKNVQYNPMSRTFTCGG